MSHKTRQKILESAQRYFLDNGFQNTSLRTIAKKANCTTGAIYNQFGSKEALFHALIRQAYDGFLELIKATSDAAQLSYNEKNTFATSAETSMRLLEYGYQHYDAFKLLIVASHGTRYEDFLEKLVEYDYSESIRFVKATTPNKLQSLLDAEYEYKIFVKLNFQAMLMPFIDDLSLAQARHYYTKVNKMFLSGWQALNLF